MVKDLISFQPLPFGCLDDIVPYLDHLIIIVDVALYELIQVALESSNNFSAFDWDPANDLLDLKVVDSQKLVSLTMIILDASEDHQALLRGVYSIIQDLSF